MSKKRKMTRGAQGGQEEQYCTEEANIKRGGKKEEEEEVLARSPPLLPSAVKGLRLEAIFYPKFENENKQDYEIRNSMCEQVGRDNNIVEVSLKHSGSLLLWSGDERYYSKNSTDNKFTHVGEILLRQHFWRSEYCFHHHHHQQQQQQQKQQEKDNSSCYNMKEERFYETCNRYIQKHRLTLCFEVVTSTLGDHGDSPLQDYLILTAVSCREQQRFFTTLELIELAQKLYLPYNDTWIFRTQQSVQDLFAFYDQKWETATAEVTMRTLTNLSNDHFIPSFYPHDVYQGEILEGIVVRFVSNNDNKNENMNNYETRFKSLQSKSKEMLQLIPPRVSSCCQLLQQQKDEQQQQERHQPPKKAKLMEDLKKSEERGNEKNRYPLVLSTDLRDLFHRCYNNNKRINEKHFHFEQALRQILQQSFITSNNAATFSNNQQQQHRKRTSIYRYPNHKQKELLPSLIQQSLTSFKNKETKRILKCIQTLNSISSRVEYPIFSTVDQHNHVRWFCMIHVFHDQTFIKYAKQLRNDRTDNGNDAMKLFRGFCIELICRDDEDGFHNTNAGNEKKSSSYNSDNQSFDISSNTTESNNEHDNNNNLMLKMKFLPYVVRTFGCRNGLSILLQENSNKNDTENGFYGYIHKYIPNLLSKWGVSSDEKIKWMQFFKAWGIYVLSHDRNIAKNKNGDKNDDTYNALFLLKERVSPTFYLEHLRYFMKQYKENKHNNHHYPIPNGNAIGASSNIASITTTFRGLVIVVSLRREISEQISDYIAKHKLDNARRINNINKEINTLQDLESFMIPTPLEDDIFNTATSSKGGGAVCSAVVEDGITSIRKIFRQQKNKQNKNKNANIHNNDNKNKIDHKDFISIMIYGCTPKDVEILYKEKKDQNRINGMLKGWKNTNCCQILEVTADEADVDNEEEKKYHAKNYEKINQIQEKQKPQEKITGPNDINHRIVLATTTETATDKQQENEKKGNDVDEQQQDLKIISSIENNKQFSDFIELVGKMSKSVPGASIMKRDKRPGMLFFFPASIPGCGKSTLLGSNDTVKQGKIKQSIISSLNLKKNEQEENKTKENRQQKQQNEEKKQSKQRDIIFKEGDVTKGKYWVAIREERKFNSSSIYFADKNVPATTWSYIGQVCAATKAIAIPIIPGYYYRDNNENLDETPSSFAADAATASKTPSRLISTPLLHTTMIPGSNNIGGGRNNKDIYYPFPLHYLAICITRVVDRKGQSHKGNLDMDAKYACLIVVNFFSFYSGISADTFHEKLRKALTNGCYATAASSTQTKNYDNDDNNNYLNEVSSSLISLVTMGRPIIAPFVRLSTCNITGSGNSSNNSSNHKEENSNLPDLPKDLEDVLKEALKVMHNWKLENITIDSLDKASKNQANDNSNSNSKKYNKQIAEDLEARLRRCIRKHKEFILDLAVAEELSHKELIRQITKQIMELDDVKVTNVIRSSSFINIASIDVPVEDIHTLVLKELLVANKNKKRQELKEKEVISLFSNKSISNMLSIIFNRKEIDDNTDLSFVNGMYIGINEFVSNTHVTMIHCSQLPQECIHSLFDDLLGCQVNVKATGVLWTEHIVALAVEVSQHCNVASGSNNDNSNCVGNNIVKGNALEGKVNKGRHLKAKEIPSPRNTFPHITLWHKADVNPAESNCLPQLVEAGKAQQIHFPTPIILQGTISYHILGGGVIKEQKK